MTLPRRLLLAGVAGVVLALCFEPVALGWLVPVPVAAFVLAVRGLRSRSAWVTGYTFGLVFYLVHTWWMRAVGVDAWLGMSIGIALFYGVLGVLAAVLLRRRGWPVWVAAAWTMIDALRGVWPFSGMPWGKLGFAVVDTPFAPALAYGGFALVGFGLALIGTLTVWLLLSARESGPQRIAAGGAVVVALAALAAPAIHPWQAHQVGDVRVAAVQGNVPGDGSDILLDSRQVTANHVDATVALAADVASGAAPRPDFVIWPENATAVDPFEDAETNAGITRAVDAIGVPILVGAIADGGPGKVLNQGIVWQAGSGAGQRYTKHHPVVFGEYIPFRSVLDNLQIGKLEMVGRDMVRGDDPDPLEIAGVEVADAICFDVAYDDVFHDQLERGAQVVAVQTSNATFIHTDQIDQQFAITRLRAIETGRWVAVASVNGVSGIIAPDGSVRATLDPRTQDVLDADLGLVSGLTPAVRLGSWPTWLMVALSAIGLVSGWSRPRSAYRRRRSGAAPAPADLPEQTRTKVTL